MPVDADYTHYAYLCKRIRDLNTSYYAGNPDVSDPVYDGLYQEMKDLEQKLGLSEDQLLLPQVGHVEATSLQEYIHRRPMLSLQTEVDSTAQGFVAFDARVRRELMIPVGEDIEYITEVKFDGLGLNLQYTKGVLTHMLTRGDGEKGENVTHALPMFGSSIPADISQHYPYDIEIRGEGMMTLEDFKNLNRELEAVGQKPMANPRNAAAGSVRTLDMEKIKNRKMIFFPYSIGGDAGPGFGKRQSDVIKKLFSIGFTLLGEGGHVSVTHGFPSDLDPYTYFEKVSVERATLGLEIDGVVHKVNSLPLQHTLGFRSKEPRWAVAQKFPPETVLTTLYAIDTQVGRTGKLTPVGKVMPVVVGGVTVSKATLHNLFDLRRRGVRVGDQVTIQRAGDVIPEIAYRNETAPRPHYVANFRFPKVCPACGSPVCRPKGEASHYCTGKDICREQIIGNIEHFGSRSAMDIQGLGERTIASLVQSGAFRNYLDIYKVSEEVYAEEGDMGPLLAKKLMVNIEASKKNYAWQFLYGLGIKEIGRTASKLLCMSLPIEVISAIGITDARHIHEKTGLGLSASEELFRYFVVEENFKRFCRFLDLPGVKLKVLKSSSEASGMTVLFTGSFPDYNRDQLKTLMQSKGGRATSSVSTNTNYVVIGEGATQHKVDKARSLNIPIVTMDEFQTILKGLS